VEDHDLVIGRDVHVQLDAVGALGEGQAEGGERVLVLVGGRAAMRDDEGQGRSPSGARAGW
jgi:hypothetical protein